MNIEKMNLDNINNVSFIQLYKIFLHRNEYMDYKTGEYIYNKHALTPKELYLYVYLSIRSSYITNTLGTSIQVLSQQISFLSVQKKNTKLIKDLLFSLKEKEVIDFKKPETNNEFIDISFTNFTNNGGFEKFYFSDFIKTSDPEKFYILCLLKVDSRDETKIPQSEFAERICKSRKYTQELLKEMSRDGLIKVASGRYVDKNRQDINTYYDDGKNNNNKEIRNNNILTYGSNLYAWDYYVYCTTKDKEIKKIGNKRFSKLAKEIIDDFKSQYNKMKKQDIYNPENQISEQDKKEIKSPVDKNKVINITKNVSNNIDTDDTEKIENEIKNESEDDYISYDWEVINKNTKRKQKNKNQILEIEDMSEL